jgi:Zn-dependent metalloprotease
LLSRVASEGTPEQRDAALKALAASASLRTQRIIFGQLRQQVGDEIVNQIAGLAPSPEADQTIYDNQHLGRMSLPGVRVRGEDDGPSADEAVNEAYDGTKTTYEFYRDVFKRNSLDDRGMELISSVHYSSNYDNAFWAGAQMVYGDASGHVFVKGSLTKALDVIAHELTHGVTSFTANLVYSKQSGALNEHFSDVFGSLVRQRHLNQTADQADWLIGAGCIAPGLGQALRSMKEPGTACKFDRQPGHMAQYVDLPDDSDPNNDAGGVHINSGIPNRAFYLAATAIGGNAWEKAGTIWYRTLTQLLPPDAQFVQAAETTVSVAEGMYGADTKAAVEQAWRQVGVIG